ncbi:anti-sigma regulatory factor (Ser/Thr protein kinase) [Streptomyces aurantiacus]|uniref:ATP-binding protein n=1 Tax=Streptomyces aurantiacus TaxID=47760 RepID=UPI00278D0F7A|nr:ATP-binding protein [Streptomyces aurantiacus]MDQ0772708.1 anti-sigma regulatory factor (Ser/Thr protein kinase) [Streptomyces aurantiacus]
MTPHTASPPELLPTTHPDREHWFGLPSLRTSVRTARDTVRRHLHTWRLPGDVCTDAVLLVSELATNAVIHSEGTRMLCGLSLTSRERLRLEVHDDGHPMARPSGARPGSEDESGRGLLIVEQLADSWGAAPSLHTRGNAVWAVLRIGP